MTEPTGEDPVVVAGKLITTLGQMSEQLAALTKYGHKNRHYAIGLAISIVLDVVLSVVLGFTLVGQVHQNSTFRQLQTAQNVANCRAQNATRVKDLAIWDSVLKPVPSESASTKVLRAEINKLVIAKDTTNRCTS